MNQQTGILVPGEEADTMGSRDWVKAMAPDMVLLDRELPGSDWERLLPSLRVVWPQLKVIALSVRPEAHQAALEAGADAFVSKGDPPEMLLAAIKQFRQAPSPTPGRLEEP